nr:hypothetical protein [Rhodococcus sp. 06-418-1B]
MTSALAGLTLPQLSTFDPPVSGEGSLDPMGLGAISERLSDVLVPGFRARMSRYRLLTAMAVGSVVCEPFESERAKDGVTTPQIAFEWIVLEAFARSSNTALRGIPGLQKARAVKDRRDRLSANSYLKGPSVFGFHGVYKPLATDLDIVTRTLSPGRRQPALIEAWERESSLTGFLDGKAGSPGGDLRKDIHAAMRRSFDTMRCEVAPTGKAIRTLAEALDPDDAGAGERSELRTAFYDGPALRSELARLLEVGLDDARTEREAIAVIADAASAELRQILDAVVAYENFARTLDVCFRTLCHVSYSLNTTPITPASIHEHPTFVESAARLPGLHRRVTDTLGSVLSSTIEFGTRFSEFADSTTPADLAELVMNHHSSIQASKPPLGKRSWFEPYKNGWLVRAGYEVSVQPALDGPFIHPTRVQALRRFLWDTSI